MFYFFFFPIATRETDVLFEVLFDEEFLGGLTIRFVCGSSVISCSWYRWNEIVGFGFVEYF